MTQPEQTPQVGEWWWVRFAYHAELAEVLAVASGSYVVRLHKHRSITTERLASEMIAKARNPIEETEQRSWWSFW